MAKKLIKLHCEPGFIQRRFNTCNWAGENSSGSIIHERNYWTMPPLRGKITPAQLVFLGSQGPVVQVAHRVLLDSLECPGLAALLVSLDSLASQESK